MPTRIELVGVTCLPAIRMGDDLGTMIASALESSGIGLVHGDVLVVAQTIVSRAEGSVVRYELLNAGRAYVRLMRQHADSERTAEHV